jgi:hypothetical protein
MDRAAFNSPGRARSRAKKQQQEQPPIASEQVHTASRARPAAPEHLLRARRPHAGNARRERSAHAAAPARALVLGIRWQAVRKQQKIG